MTSPGHRARHRRALATAPSRAARAPRRPAEPAGAASFASVRFGDAAGRIALLVRPTADLVGRTRFFLRVVGARDLALGVGVLAALDRDAPVRGWLRASAAVDGLDAAGCLVARHHLRPMVFPAAIGAATAGTLLSGWLAGQLDG